jgi:hypothetical protein
MAIACGQSGKRRVVGGFLSSATFGFLKKLESNETTACQRLIFKPRAQANGLEMFQQPASEWQ